MSTEKKATISRILLLKNPIHLYRLLKSKEEIIKTTQAFNDFIFVVDKYLDGCRCDEDFNKSSVINEYKLLEFSLDAGPLLKEYFRCNDVIFSKDDNNW